MRRKDWEIIDKEEIVEDDEKEKALRKILKHYGSDDDYFRNTSLIDSTVCFKLKVKCITGKKRSSYS